MASAYKNIAKLVGSTGDVIVYTCPDATEAIIKNVQLYNSHSGSIVVLSKITDSSASVTLGTLAATSESADRSLAGPFVLEAGDTFVLNCATASKIFVFASVLELS